MVYGWLTSYLYALVFNVVDNDGNKIRDKEVMDYIQSVPAVYEEMILSGCTPDRKARAMLRSALRYMKQAVKLLLTIHNPIWLKQDYVFTYLPLACLCLKIFVGLGAKQVGKGLKKRGRPNPKSDTFSKKVNEEKKILSGQIGSRPPRCDRRCSSCGHCEAIQVPTNPQVRNGNKNFSTLLFGVAYARRVDNSNYKPMSWKCKCGNVIFNP
ncbi:hypothetical protein GOBAR_DD27542 [Gossypium barbadense]|nr:hypothetical protein GOBAR_DD27542 [Gossypium barbadense]